MSARSTRRAWILPLAGLTFLIPFGFADNLDVARQNPILRDHFLRLYLNTRVSPPFRERSYEADFRFVDRYMDRLIEDYLKRVNERVGRLKAHFREVQRARRGLRALSDDERRKAGVGWTASLKEVADQADSLRKMISNVLGGLDHKSNFRVDIGDNARVTTYREEIEFMEEQILKAEQRIQDYFFRPTHVVQVEDLRGENMMIYLYRVRKMADQLRKEYPFG